MDKGKNKKLLTDEDTVKDDGSLNIAFCTRLRRTCSELLEIMGVWLLWISLVLVSSAGFAF